MFGGISVRFVQRAFVGFFDLDYAFPPFLFPFLWGESGPPDATLVLPPSRSFQTDEPEALAPFDLPSTAPPPPVIIF